MNRRELFGMVVGIILVIILALIMVYHIGILFGLTHGFNIGPAGVIDPILSMYIIISIMGSFIIRKYRKKGPGERTDKQYRYLSDNSTLSDSSLLFAKYENEKQIEGRLIRPLNIEADATTRIFRYGLFAFTFGLLLLVGTLYAASLFNINNMLVWIPGLILMIIGGLTAMGAGALLYGHSFVSLWDSF